MAERGGPWRIVLADDNPLDLAEAKAALLRGSTRRYTFLEAASAADAVRRCAEAPPPDCAVIDFNLPDGTALDVLAALPVDAQGLPLLPTVILTGSVEGPESHAVLRAGAQDFVAKDWLTPHSLTRAVESAVERHAMALELRASEANARAIYEQAAAGIVTCTPDGRFLKANPAFCALLGYTWEELRLKNVFDLTHPDDLAADLAATELVLAGESESYSLEKRYIRKDGTPLWVHLGSSPVRNIAGAVEYAVGVIVDISERKRADLELRRIEREREELLIAERAARSDVERVARIKDEFLATLSHELRTPLNAIVGWAQILQRTADPKLIREGINVIARNAQAQAQLIADLLDMNRIISGKLKMEVGAVDPNLVAAAALDTVRPAAEAKGVRLIHRLTPGMPQVRGDSGRLQQVLWNLLTNAVKFTSEGGEVTVSTEVVSRTVRFVVEDTGQGLDPQFLPLLFDRFSQADASAARKHGGLGLGLSIVRQLTEMHGGTVGAESAGLGQGARFTVSLPAAHPAAAESPTPPTDRPPGSGEAGDSFETGGGGEAAEVDLTGISVLLIDDQPDALEAARRLLVESGARVSTATSAAAALDSLRHEQPDVLLSDIGMPGMDGYQLIREIREGLGIGPERLPAAAFTAFARTEDRDRALAAGFQAHIGKPFRPQSLLATVAALAASTTSAASSGSTAFGGR